MEKIESLLEQIKEIDEKEINIQKTINRLQKEINSKSAEIYRLSNVKFDSDISNLNSKKEFLQNYRLIPKGFFTNLFKKIPEFLGCTIFIFVLFIAVVIFGSINLSDLNLNLLSNLLAISGLASCYGVYIDPIVIAFRINKDILREYGSISKIDMEIEFIKVKQKENQNQINILKSEVQDIQYRQDNWKELYSQYTQSKVLLNCQIQDEMNRIWHIDEIWNEICHNGYYIDDIDLSESLTLNLSKNKKNRF